MMRKCMWLMGVSVLLLGLAACGGGGSSTAASGTDTISMVSVSPASAVANQSTAFAVEVSYSLTTQDSGLLMVGFNTDVVDAYTMISEQTYTVSRGNGAHTFNVAATPVDWGSSGPFQVYVNLSPNPHPSTWTPLARDAKTIYLSTGSAKPFFGASEALGQCKTVFCF